MAKGFIPLAKQMDFLWSELQGKEKAGFGKFLTAGVNTPEDYATLWDQTYERSGGAGDAKARDYAGSVYAAMAGGNSNQELISPNAKFTYGYLTNKGMTPQQAAGVTGRLMAESYEEMNPDARNTMAGGNGTYGVAQWRGSRMNDLANFAGVDVGGITSLPATTPGGGLLTSSGGANMMPMDPTKKPYMMGGDQTYSFNPQASQQAAQQAQPQQAQPQQGGLGGLLSSLKDKAMAVDPQTGLTGLEQFAVALDPLIMTELRGGEAIQQRGAQRVSAGNKNRTIEMLRARGRDDLADMVERGMISISDAAGQMLTVPKEKGRTVDAAALRKMFPGAQIEDGLYNLKPDGTATKVGGGGVNVKVGGDEGVEAFDKEFGQLDARKLAAIDNVGSSASRSLTQINRLETLLGNVPTGMSANIKQLAGNFGIQSEGLDDIQAAAAIINALVPAQRPPGSGPMSDADLELFKQSLPRIINSPGGNQMIIDTMRGLAQYDAMGSEIVQRFRAKEISKVDAFKLLNSRPDPFASFKASVGPVETDMSGEAARKLLEKNQ